MLFAAAVHDFEHTGRGIKLVHPKSLAPSSTFRWFQRAFAVSLSLKGTTNNFHVQTKSRLAMIYNDRSVLENHHLSVAFRLLQNPDIDILDGLSSDEFKVPLVLWPILYRLYIDGIFIHGFIGISNIGNWYGASNRHVIAFSTNQGKHQSNNMHFVARIVGQRITLDAWQEMKKSCSAPDTLDRGSTMGFIVHAADISHPTKVWDLHSRWTDGLVEEFFRQVCNKKF